MLTTPFQEPPQYTRSDVSQDGPESSEVANRSVTSFGGGQGVATPIICAVD